MNNPTPDVNDATKAIAAQGYAIIPNALPQALISALHKRATTLHDGDYKPAGTGRDRGLNSLVRQDRIKWISPNADCQALTASYDPEVQWLDCMESLRQRLNRELFMGLRSYESHFAHYPAGHVYKKHMDAFQGQASRKLSTVLYLNAHWGAQDAGELVLYQAAESHKVLQRIHPIGNTLVLFLSDEFPHEVLPAKRDRYSIAGWFRVDGLV